MKPICNSHFLSRRMLLLVVVALTSAIGSVRAQQPVSNVSSVQTILHSQQKWLFAHTSRLPLDPLESWNQWPATVDMDGDRVRLNVIRPWGAASVFTLQVQAAGFTFDWLGHAEFFMRFDATDANAPFKGRSGNMTIWLLRTP